MQDLRSYYAKEFARFYKSSFPNKPCKAVPASLEDLNFTEKTVLMDWENGVLYQNLFRVTDPKVLPANLLRDEAKGIIDYQNKDLYRQYGYEHQAQRIEQAEAEYQQKKINDEIAAMKKRNAEQEARNEAKSKLTLGQRMMLEPLTQEQIINNQMKYHGHIGRS